MELSPKDIKLQKENPEAFELVKKLDPLLEKHGLVGHVARVGLVLDISYSMQNLYNSGAIQQLVDRFMPLAHRFDDNGAIDVFSFGEYAYDIGEVSTSDNEGFVKRMLREHGLEGYTRYHLAMQEVRNHYFEYSGSRTDPHTDGEPPIYMAFVTDGDTQHKDRCISELRSASYEPIFWQFIALGADYVPGNERTETVKTKGFLGFGGGEKQVKVGGCPREFQFLNDLDEQVPDRFVDNANFFAIRSPTEISDEDLFDRLMGEYPEWLALPEVKQHLLA